MPDLRQGCATGKTVEDTAAADALVLFGPWRTWLSRSVVEEGRVPGPMHSCE